MGLDMFLTKKSYVKNWDHMKPEELHKITVKKGGKDTHIQSERVNEIEEEIGYWRKANAVHHWFVENVQEGNDDCKPYYVRKEKLQELLDTVNKVLASCELVEGKITNGYRGTPTGLEPIIEDGKYVKDPSLAQELLPTQDGFFFGSTDYNQFYVEDLELTKAILEKAITESEHGSIYYQSSW